MFKVGDKLIKIKSGSGFEETIGDIGVVKKNLEFAFLLEIVEGAATFKGKRDYFMSNVENWVLLETVDLENK